jgi:hypothetical protein
MIWPSSGEDSVPAVTTDHLALLSSNDRVHIAPEVVAGGRFDKTFGDSLGTQKKGVFLTPKS